MKIIKKIFKWIRMYITHNKCDTCGWTKDEVFLNGFHTRFNIIQCEKCYNKLMKSEWYGNCKKNKKWKIKGMDN